ncbi:MAG TPA: PAS domain-containing protein [Terriglobales bacterium]|nr:PAS domain-containing protein [Terriglobales bacterium]
MSASGRSKSVLHPPCDDAISKTSLRSILDNSPDAVARFDRQLRHQYVNAATARENNRPVEDFYGRTMEQLGHTNEISQLINQNLKEVFRTGEEATFDVSFSGPHGLRLFQCRMAPERKSDGSFDYVICFSRDLTKERLAERKLVDAEKSEAVNRVHNEIAHEISNPLQGLRNTVYLLKHSSSPQQAQQSIELADVLLSRVEALLKQMLNASEELSLPLDRTA